MKKILFLLFLVDYLFSYGQNPLVRQWDYRYGGSGNDGINAWLPPPSQTFLRQTSDDGFVVAGASASGISGDKSQACRGNYDYWMVKTDSMGIKQWDADFGGTGTDYLLDVNQTSDHGYIFGGWSSSGIGGDKTQACWGSYDYWIVKTDSNGVKQWDKDFGGLQEEALYSVLQTTDGGFMLGGFSYSGVSGDKTQPNRDATNNTPDYWIVKTDSSGNILWDRSYGGAARDEFHSMQQTSDGGFILGGNSMSGIGGDKTQPCQGGSDYWIVKTDSLGNILWDKTFGGSNYDYLFCVRQTSDGGYILGGYSLSGVSGDKTQANFGGDDLWIVKVDGQGNYLWDKVFGGTANEDEFGNMVETADKGFLMAGTSYSGVNGNKADYNLGHEQTWIVKIDSLGNKQWDKSLHTATGSGDDESGNVIQTRGGCYVMSNYTQAGIGGDKTQSDQGGTDYWIIKFCDSINTALPHSMFFSSDSIFCEEPTHCINFSDLSTGNPTSWQWSFPGGTPSFSNLQNPDSICYYNAGTYPVTLIVGNGTGYDTLMVSPMIIVGGIPPNPTIAVVGADTLTSSYGSSYQWYLDGNVIAGATDSSWVASQTGTYSVRITGVGGCSSLSAGTYIDITSGWEVGNWQLAVGISFDPIRGQFSIVFNRPCSDVLIKVFNVFGEAIYAERIQDGVMKKDVFLDATAGIYFLILSEDKNNVVKKVVIE